MSKDNESSAGDGFLSRMVKFVTNQTTSWSDLETPQDRQGVSAESHHGGLKDMVERKRQYDEVRHREFDLLRKLRRQARGEANAPGGAPMQPESPEDRERTLKKIDEIEAQMAASWFRKPSTHRDGEYSATQAPDTKPLATRPPAPAAQPASPTQPVPPVQPESHDVQRAFAPTELMDPRERQASDPGDAPARPAAAPISFDEMDDLNIEVTVKAHYAPEIQEAAILHANGDSAGAEAVLQGLLHGSNPLRHEKDTWLMLMDLYRATGEREKFTDLAIEFSDLFDRSAPQSQFALTDMAQPDMAPSAAATSGSSRFSWSSPLKLSTQSVATLNAVLKRTPAPWSLNWRSLKSIDADAVGPLADTLQDLGEKSVRLRMMGSDHLLTLLEEQTPNGDASVKPVWWQARLALLRILGNMEDFDMAALDYCVTYEISPPAWQAPLAHYVPAGDDAATLVPTRSGMPGDAATVSPTLQDEDGASAPPTLPSLSGAGDSDNGTARFKLSGDLLESAEPVLKAVHTTESTRAFEVDCRKLRRADFAAAVDLLNWAITQRAEGRSVSFKQVSRLVAVFFGVVGLPDAARVLLRND